MNPIELKARREALGLNQTDLARVLGVKQVTVSAWELGRNPIPPGIDGELIEVEERLEGLIDLAAEMLDATTNRPVFLDVWADDESCWEANPHLDGFPAVCYRVAMARARMLADDPNTTRLRTP